ncbi:hypothetical protein Tco_1313799 [Tanacetum coccineum]
MTAATSVSDGGLRGVHVAADVAAGVAADVAYIKKNPLPRLEPKTSRLGVKGATSCAGAYLHKYMHSLFF